MTEEKQTQTEQAGEGTTNTLLPPDWEHHHPEDLKFSLDMAEGYLEMRSDQMHDLMAERIEQLQNSHGANPQAQAKGPHQPDTQRADREHQQPPRQHTQDGQKKGDIER